MVSCRDDHLAKRFSELVDLQTRKGDKEVTVWTWQRGKYAVKPWDESLYGKKAWQPF